MEHIKLLQTGGDFEVFLQDVETKEIISAEGFIKGEKEFPFNFDTSNKFYATSLDNVLAEFCIPPSTSAEEFYLGVAKSMEYIESVIPGQLCIAAIPSARLDTKWLKTIQAKTFGCEADYNAYAGGAENQRPGLRDDMQLRSAGAHVHLSYENPNPYMEYFYEGDEARINIIKALDLFMGVPSILSEPENDRRKLYGRAGSFRPKPYGVEYRTLSNHMLSTKEGIVWMYNTPQKAIDFLNGGNIIGEQMGKMMQHVINTGNKKQAEKIVKQFNLEVI